MYAINASKWGITMLLLRVRADGRGDCSGEKGEKDGEGYFSGCCLTRSSETIFRDPRE